MLLILVVLVLAPSSSLADQSDIEHCTADDHTNINAVLDAFPDLRPRSSLLDFIEQGRIVGGVPALVHEHPWTVSIRKVLNCNHFCGGSLISSHWVVSAAHCLWKQLPWKIFVVAGGRSREGRDPGDQAIMVQEIINHKNFKSCKRNWWNDIALIRLKEDVTVTGDFVKLPGPRALTVPLTGSVELVGFGTVAFRGPSAVKLHKIYLDILPDKNCTTIFRKPKPLMFCAGEKGKDSCQGDSGSGTVQDETLVGLVSHGHNCGKLPGVYTDVRHHVIWIRASIKRSEERPLETDTEVWKKVAFKDLILRLFHCHNISPTYK